MNNFKFLVLLFMVVTLTIGATNRSMNRQVVFKYCFERPAGWHGRKHRSPAVPLVGYLNDGKLLIEDCSGCIVKCLHNNVEFYVSTVPENGEIELPKECLDDIMVYIEKGSLVYCAMINLDD